MMMTTCIDVLAKEVNKRVVVVFDRAQKNYITIKLGLKISFVIIDYMQIK